MPITAAAVSSKLTIRNMPFLADIWQGGALALLDKEVSGSKVGYLRLLGHINPTGGGASLQTRVKSAEFISAMATGVGVVEGKPISQIDPTIQVKLNAPNMASLAKLLFSSDPTTETRAADTDDIVQSIAPTWVAGVWYQFKTVAGVHVFNITNLDVEQGVTVLDNGSVSGTPDYEVDTELGVIRFFTDGTNTLTPSVDTITLTFAQGAAATSRPMIAPGAVPRFTYGGLYIYIVLAANEARDNTEIWLRYMPRARIEPTGNFDVSVDKPAEITLDIMGVPSSEISGQPYGFLKQIAGTMRSIVL